MSELLDPIETARRLTELALEVEPPAERERQAEIERLLADEAAAEAQRALYRPVADAIETELAEHRGNGPRPGLRQPSGAAETAADPAAEMSAKPPALAACDDILDRFIDALHDAGVVGEDRFAKVLYLAMTTRVLDKIVSVCVKGVSAAGKSWVVERALGFFPPSAYYSLTSMSEHALAYVTEPLSHRFLIVYEAAGLESEFASYLARSLLSEGCIEYLTVEKVKGGGLVPRRIRIEGPTGLIETTTRVSLHPENETRMLSIVANDTPEQTKAVLLRTAFDEGTTPPVPAEWPALQGWVESAEHRVSIPYAIGLAELIPPVAVRLRRDFATILSLVKAHAILCQRKRQRDEDGRILATVDDYAVVRELVGDLIADQVEATVSPQVREAVEAVATLRAEREGAPVTYSQLATKLGLDASAARRRALSAISRGYLKNDQTLAHQPAKLAVGEPMPGELILLPLPEDLL